MVVTTDGIKQEGQQWGSDHGLEVDVNNADKIEIIKGASALVYGSDAVAGVINIRPVLPKGKDQFTAGQHVSFNSLNNAKRSSTFIAANKGGKWFKLRYSFLSAGDYSVPSNSFGVPINHSTDLCKPIEKHRGEGTRGQCLCRRFQKLGILVCTCFVLLPAVRFFLVGLLVLPSIGILQHDGDFNNIDLPYQDVNHLNLSTHANILINSNWLEIDAGISAKQ